MKSPPVSAALANWRARLRKLPAEQRVKATAVIRALILARSIGKTIGAFFNFRLFIDFSEGFVRRSKVGLGAVIDAASQTRRRSVTCARWCRYVVCL